MQISVRSLLLDEMDKQLDSIARLRIEVFRDYPYLYDGDLDYEAEYLRHYKHKDAIIVGAFDGDTMIGASTGSPMQDHADEFAAPFIARGYDLDDIFYCGESVLLKPYRGYGIGKAFFHEREAHAKKLNKQYICFCAVVRDDNHPLKPADYRGPEGLWYKQGYSILDGVVARFAWKDINQPAPDNKTLQFWMKSLG